MRCFNEKTAPVLCELAKHYALLVNWFSSVPGETWPNRNFAHAATSHGQNKIVLDFYTDTTIFDRLGPTGWRVGGEALIARIYSALAEDRDFFASTLFLITYDEHGGFYDHEHPVEVEPPDEYVAEDGFDFSISGVRVPAVAISPLIPRGWIDRRRFDHASIPKSCRGSASR